MFGLQAIGSGSASASSQALIDQYRAELQQAQKADSDAQTQLKELQQQTQAAQLQASRDDYKVRQLQSQQPSTGSASLTSTTQEGIYGASLLSGALLDVSA